MRYAIKYKPGDSKWRFLKHWTKTHNGRWRGEKAIWNTLVEAQRHIERKQDDDNLPYHYRLVEVKERDRLGRLKLE